MSAPREGWGLLFASAFAQSRNAMVLVDAQRRLVDVNAAFVVLLERQRGEVLGRPIAAFVADGPVMSAVAWAEAITGTTRVTGEVELLRPDETRVAVQWAATPTVVDGRRLLLVVALSTARWGRHFRRVTAPETGGAPLTHREREVVTLVAHGRSGPEIAEDLQISHETVRTHVRNAMTKTGARSRAHLVAKAVGEGLVLHAGAADHATAV